jgi:hypothetical protein
MSELRNEGEQKQNTVYMMVGRSNSCKGSGYFPTSSMVSRVILCTLQMVASTPGDFWRSPLHSPALVLHHASLG